MLQPCLTVRKLALWFNFFSRENWFFTRNELSIVHNLSDVDLNLTDLSNFNEKLNQFGYNCESLICKRISLIKAVFVFEPPRFWESRLFTPSLTFFLYPLATLKGRLFSWHFSQRMINVFRHFYETFESAIWLVFFLLWLDVLLRNK